MHLACLSSRVFRSFPLLLLLVFYFLLLSLVFAASGFPPHHSPTILTSIVFASCNNQNKAQPLWPLIINQSPDLFIWTGDVIYGDSSFLAVYRWPSSQEHMRKEYQKQKYQPEYKRLAEKTPIIGVYDDHDYGENDGNKHYHDKKSSQQLFLDFLDTPPASPRRSRSGIYTSYTYGEKGRKVKVILLDTRYHQDPDTDDMLGEEQWDWLKRQLDYTSTATHRKEEEGEEEWENGKKTPPDLILLISSIQVIPHRRRIGEGWRNFPKSRSRLFSLIANSHLNSALLILSGDVHYGELIRTDTCTYPHTYSYSSYPSGDSSSVTIHPLVEITSSGLTHSIGRQLPLSSIILPALLYKPTLESLIEADAATGADALCLDLNYGLIKINWEEEIIFIQLLGLNDKLCLDVQYTFKELTPYTVDKSQLFIHSAHIDQTNNINQTDWPLYSSSDNSLSTAYSRCLYEEKEKDIFYSYTTGIKVAASVLSIIIASLIISIGLGAWFAYTCIVDAQKSRKAIKNRKAE